VTNIAFLFKALQMQNLKRKKWGDGAYDVPPSEKVGGHVPRVPHQITPMIWCAFLYKELVVCRATPGGYPHGG